jgi:hypothetical protein
MTVAIPTGFAPAQPGGKFGARTPVHLPRGNVQSGHPLMQSRSPWLSSVAVAPRRSERATAQARASFGLHASRFPLRRRGRVRPTGSDGATCGSPSPLAARLAPFRFAYPESHRNVDTRQPVCRRAPAAISRQPTLLGAWPLEPQDALRRAAGCRFVLDHARRQRSVSLSRSLHVRPPASLRATAGLPRCDRRPPYVRPPASPGATAGLPTCDRRPPDVRPPASPRATAGLPVARNSSHVARLWASMGVFAPTFVSPSPSNPRFPRTP